MMSKIEYNHKDTHIYVHMNVQYNVIANSLL